MKEPPTIQERRTKAVAAMVRARDRSAEALEKLTLKQAPDRARVAVTEAHADLESLVAELLGDRRAA